MNSGLMVEYFNNTKKKIQTIMEDIFHQDVIEKQDLAFPEEANVPMPEARIPQKLPCISESQSTITRLETEMLCLKEQMAYLKDIMRQMLRDEMTIEEAKKEYPGLASEDMERKLSMSIYDLLDLDTRTHNCLRTMKIRTLEDLLMIIHTKGFNALRYHRGFGKVSLTHLKRELFEKGICDEQGECKL